MENEKYMEIQNIFQYFNKKLSESLTLLLSSFSRTVMEIIKIHLMEIQNASNRKEDNIAKLGIVSSFHRFPHKNRKEKYLCI